MPKCKNCIHYEVCRAHYEINGTPYELCGLYKDRALFIESPCKVGDTLYSVGRFTEQIVPMEVKTIVYDRHGIYLVCDGGVTVFAKRQLGKTIFLTREAAERSIAEKERQP